MTRWPSLGSRPVVSVSRMMLRMLPAVAFDRRLDLRDRALDLVVSQIALRTLAVGQGERAIDLGLKLAQAQGLGNRRRRLVHDRLRAPADDDHGQVVAFRTTAQLGLAHECRRGLENRGPG